MKLKYSVGCCLLALGLSAQAAPGYYRAPALSGDTLVFTAEGDLWTQSLGAEKAQRLTTQAAEEKDAALSKDGKTLAYVANYEGADELYLMPLTGGLPKRVTFEQSRVRLQGWTADGKLLYATDNSFGPANSWVLRLVDPSSLETTDLPLADAVEGSLDAKGQYLYFTRFGLQVTGDNAKVYKGGAKGVLWRYKLGSDQEAVQLSAQDAGSDRNPMVKGDRLYYLSDADGNPNLWSMALDGSDNRQLTHHKDWQVKDPYLDGQRIVYQLGADLHLYDLASGQDQALAINLVGDQPYRQPRWLKDPLKYATSAKLAPKGDKVVITARSHVALAGIDGSRLVELAQAPHSRLRSAVADADGKWVYGISDASGEQEIWRYAADGSAKAEQLTKDGQTLRHSLVLSPNGRLLAHDDNDGNLWLLDLVKGSNRKLLSQGAGLGPIGDISWSGDSRYLAVAGTFLGNERSRVMLLDLEKDQQQLLTSDKYESFSPAFSPDGKWLYFLSNRAFNATPGSPWGDRNMGPMFDKRTLVFALALDPKAAFPFQAPSELPQEPPAKGKAQLEWGGIAGRLWQVPVAAGNYNKLSVTPERLYMLDSDARGKQALISLGIDRRAPKLDKVADDIADYGLSADQKQLLVRKQSKPEEMLVVPAAASLPKDLSQAKVQAGQWQLALAPADEWQQMFEDAWLMHRDSFYDPAMHGLDWQAVKAKYQPLVARVGDRYELSDLLGQMIGELDALHSQVRGGDLPANPEAAKAAALGARLTQSKDGVRIGHIFETDPELPDQAGPLAKPGVDVRQGDLLVAINGRSVSTLAEATLALRNQAGKQVLLGLKRGNAALEQIVYPVDLAAQAKLRYLDWVEQNRQAVTKASGGNIGYLHLYAMGTGDIESFAREFYANYRKDGLIIDVRRNRGGNIDSWVIEKLLRRAWMFWQPTHGDANSNMQQSFRGHLAVLTDQLTYSDGETFSAGIKALGIAPLIGKRTAGAGVWLSGRNALADGGMARVAEYPQYALDGHWVVEGYGVEPDMEVSNLPHATFKGEDAQLKAALDYLAKVLKEQPVAPLKAKPMTGQPRAKDIMAR